jgi:PTH1 family peptidyl-tRNA hydrolase
MRRPRSSKVRRGTPADLLVIGLGNPGEKYARTRHNVGAEVVELLAQRHGGRLRPGKENALVDEVRIGEHRVALAFPTTFMNDSGRAAAPLVRRYGIEDFTCLIVVQDELDLEVGRVKLKMGGGLAGHNGLRSLRDHLHSTEFVRLRIGVGKPRTKEQGAGHVLKKVGPADRTELDIAVQVAADAVESILANGFEATMNQVNSRS